MSSVWNGSISLSLISIPVKLEPSSGSSDLPLHQFSPAGNRIGYKRFDKATGNEVRYEDVRKGYEAPDGSVVLLTSEELEEALGKASRDAGIITFTSRDSIPAEAVRNTFYVRPGSGGDRAYALLARTLREAGKVAILKLGIRERKRLVMLSATDNGYLMAAQLEWHSDLRSPAFAAPSGTFTDNELSLARTIVDSLSGEFSYEGYEDDSQARLSEVVSRKLKGGLAVPAQFRQGSVPAPADLSELLARSVEQAKAARAGQQAGSGNVVQLAERRAAKAGE